jgi:putative membrane protein
VCGGAGFLWPLGIVVHLAFWALLIGGIVWLVRRGTKWQPAGTGHLSVDMLAERYARGEIDRDEYVDRRSVLEREPQ